MLTLNDGRNELWQWDTWRTLSVDAECSQVHFSNKVFGRSIDVDVIDGVAIIPDILLQTDKDLNVWAFVGTAENGYTKISKTFKVNRRNKPADYVFTPPEQTSLEEIKKEIEYLKSIQDPDAIKNAVEDYLEQNPVEAPVQSVNGKTGEVELTSEDVGAISQDDLQEATNEALAQAKASGEFDGQPGKDGKDGKDGYTPVKGVDYFDGKDGKNGENGEDYVLTEADKQEIAEQAAELVEIPEGSGGGIAVTGATVGQTVKIAAVDEEGVPTAWEPVDMPSGEKEWSRVDYDFSSEFAASVKLDLPISDIREGYLRFTLKHDGVAVTDVTNFRIYADRETISGSHGYLMQGGGLYTTEREGFCKWDIIADSLCFALNCFNSTIWTHTGYQYFVPKKFLHIAPLTSGVLIKGTATLYYR